MERYYKVEVTSVDYDVTANDVFDGLERRLGREATDEELDAEIKRVENELPQELELEITCEPEDLDDEVADAISNETGWLISTCSYAVTEQGDFEENSLIFTGDEGENMAEQYAMENDIKDYDIEWDDYEKGYRLTWRVLDIIS